MTHDPRMTATAASTPDEVGPPGSKVAELRGSAPDTKLPRGIMVLIGLAMAWFAIQACQGLAEIISPVFFALNLMIVVYPIKATLSRRGAPEWVGSLACGLVAFIVLIAFFASLGWALAVLVSELPHYGPQFNQLYQQSLDLLSRFGVSKDQLSQGLHGFDPSSLMGVVTKAFSSLSNGVSLLVVILTTMVFLIMDAADFDIRLPIVAQYHPHLAEALRTFASGTRRYWVVCTVFGLIVAVLDLIILWILKVPLAIPWAVLSFLTNYIPSVGFVIGIIPPALMALLARGPVIALIVVIAYCVINFVAQSIIQPKVAGDALGVTPTVTFLSLLFWAWVFGGMGALLALPATLLIKAIFVDADPQARWLNAFIASKPKDATKGDAGEEAALAELADPDDEADAPGGATVAR